MSYLMASILLMGTLIFSLSWVLSRRKNVIDQLESDVRIFLTLVLIASFYFRFSNVSIIYFITLFLEFELEYVVTSLYFLFPVVLGFSLYLLTPRLCERILHPKNIPVPDSVIKISTLLGLSNIPRVCTTSLEIPPFVYGRRRNSSTLVLPQHMESFLTEEEQEAVIAHELSHIKQGDTGVITWLTFLLEGIKYWILPIPIFIYFGMTSLFFGTERSLVPGVLILLFYVAVFLLKNSLSRIRESISDAYVVFYGYENTLKSALYKYAAFKTDYKGGALALCFHRGTKYHPVLATHPPLTERLETIDKKRFIVEPMRNLSVELAFWVGLVSAFLSFNGMFGIGSLIIIREMVFSTPSSDFTLDLMWLIPSIAAMGVVGISYLFPSTKGLVLFSDLGDSTFLLPLVRNWGITILTAAIIIYGLTVTMSFVIVLVPFMCVGFFVWFVGFSASRSPHIGEKMWALPALPFFPLLVLWFPVQVVYSWCWNSVIDLWHFVPLMMVDIAVVLTIFLLLLETGHYAVSREQIIQVFGKKIEAHNLIVYSIVANILMYSVPTAISFGLYSLFCFVDALQVLPELTLFFVVLLILIPYTFIKSDILIFTELSYYIEILQGKICKKDAEFLQKVIRKYQLSDGGFDCGGLRTPTQKDTSIMVKAAHILGVQMENDRVKAWIKSTEKDQGFALYPGGRPRVEGLYYAVKSLFVLGVPDKVSPAHAQWIRDCYNGEYFTFKYDTLSPLLQTCLAVEVLSRISDLHDMKTCRKWIESRYSETLRPEEAFFATRALILLGSDTEPAERWLKTNRGVLNTRLDKNAEAVYYFVKILHELAREIPPLVTEEACHELGRVRKKYEKRFGLPG